MYRMKSRGPSTEPCGTPWMSWNGEDLMPLMVTEKVREER